VNRAWIDHQWSHDYQRGFQVKGRESKSLRLFSKFCKVTELQMATASRFGDVPRQEIACHWGLVEG